jgi:hypothetical protein
MRKLMKQFGSFGKKRGGRFPRFFWM